MIRFEGTKYQNRAGGRHAGWGRGGGESVIGEEILNVSKGRYIGGNYIYSI
jgi:hypothetical protein